MYTDSIFSAGATPTALKFNRKTSFYNKGLYCISFMEINGDNELRIMALSTLLELGVEVRHLWPQHNFTLAALNS